MLVYKTRITVIHELETELCCRSYRAVIFVRSSGYVVQTCRTVVYVLWTRRKCSMLTGGLDPLRSVVIVLKNKL